MVSVLNSGAEGPGFKLQSRRCRITVLGKLFTPTVPLFTTVTFPAAGHHRPLTGTKLYCLVTEARVCGQLAQGCCLKVERPRVEPATFCVASQHPSHYTTGPREDSRLLYLSLRPN